MDVVVARIRTEQWPVLRALRLRALEESPGAFLGLLADEAAYPADEWQRRAAERSVGSDGCTFLAFVDGEPAGIVGGGRSVDDPATAELVAMWTAPEHRGRGVGAALVGAVADWAADAGAGRLVLWVMRGNDGAAAFYRALDFDPTDEVLTLADHPCAEEHRMVLDLTAR